MANSDRTWGRRRLGASGLEVSAIGLGGWSIGGPCWRDGKPLGYGTVDDDESVRAIHHALDLGIGFFDTSDMYGAGHSERVIGRALKGRRDRVTLATKFGYRIDEASRQILGSLALPNDLEAACDASLGRLRTDVIDLYLLHLRDFPIERIETLLEPLNRLREQGKIRAFGWSTDDPRRAAAIAPHHGCVAIEQAFNLLQGSADTLAICEDSGLASIQRSPLAMGYLLPKKNAPRTISPSRDDVRSSFNRTNALRPLLERAESIGLLLEDAGIAPLVASLSYLLQQSAVSIPIPGFRTAAQVEQLASALRAPPLSAELIAAIDRLATPRDLPANPWDLRDA